MAEFKAVSEGHSWNYWRQNWTHIFGFCRCSKTGRGELAWDIGFGRIRGLVQWKVLHSYCWVCKWTLNGMKKKKLFFSAKNLRLSRILDKLTNWLIYALFRDFQCLTIMHCVLKPKIGKPGDCNWECTETWLTADRST